MLGATGPLQEAHDGGFVMSAGALDDALPLGDVHVLGLAADVGLIDFDFPVHDREVIVAHGLADAVEHEPCGLLGHAERTGQLVGRDAVLGVAEHPDGGQPLGQLDRGALEDGTNLDRELVTAEAALPPLPGLHEIMLGDAPALGARLLPLGPTHVGDELDSLVFVSEEADGLEESLGQAVGLVGHRSESLECVEYLYNTRIHRVPQVCYCPCQDPDRRIK